jgi:hypothetical protein
MENKTTLKDSDKIITIRIGHWNDEKSANVFHGDVFANQDEEKGFATDLHCIPKMEFGQLGLTLLDKDNEDCGWIRISKECNNSIAKLLKENK